jgi:hypothetical protein
LTESSLHLKLKEIAEAILREQGFQKIEFEKTLNVQSQNSQEKPP